MESESCIWLSSEARARLEGWVAAAPGWDRVLHLFAQDVTLRRTSLASAAGLVVTAYVFFPPTRSGRDRP